MNSIVKDGYADVGNTLGGNTWFSQSNNFFDDYAIML